MTGAAERNASPVPARRSVSALVLRNVAWLGAGEVWTKGGLFLVSILIARGLGSEKLGVFQVASGAAQVMVTLFVFGQIEPLIRETAKRPALALAFQRTSRRIQARLALWVAPLAIAGALAVRDADLRRAFLAFLLWSLLRTAGMTWSATYRGLDRMHEEVAARGLEIVADVALVWAVASLDGPAWLLGLAMAAGAALAVARLALRARGLSGAVSLGAGAEDESASHPVPAGDAPSRSGELPASPPGTATAAGTPASSGREAAFFAREGTSFLALAVLFQVLLKIDTFVMAGLGLPKEEIGRYAVAVIPVWGALALPQLLAFATLPTLSRLAARRQRPSLPLAAVAVLGLAAGLAAALSLHALREPLVDGLFGPEYEASKALLGRLAWALPGASTAMLVGALLAAWGRQRLAVTVKAIALGVSLVLDLIWIPVHGPAAAAEVAVIAHSGEAVLLVTLAALGTARISAARSRRPPPTGD